MIPVNIRNDFTKFGVRKLLFGEDQPEVSPLPALFYAREGYVLTEWQLTPEEREAIASGGRVRVFTHTFGRPFQPVQLVVVGPDDMLPLETVS